MTHGQFTIDDYTNTQTLYTFHDGHTVAAVIELYSLMDYWVTRSADSVRWLNRKPMPKNMDVRYNHPEWKNRNCPGWCDLIIGTTSQTRIQTMLDTPGRLERCYDTGVRYENADAIGIGQLMVNRHWNRWFPYPENYRGHPRDRFLVKILQTGDDTMDYQMHVELSEDDDQIPDILEGLKGVPCLEFSKDRPLPTVHFGKQFWHAMRREIQTLVKYADR